ncbi:MAG: hypothetical protein APR53_02990 [Methanoculleus sp. SDB]|nr:MAG: hypothetical protein APR53_02990 [Methanoculleus sp. SDB]
MKKRNYILTALAVCMLVACIVPAGAIVIPPESAGALGAELIALTGPASSSGESTAASGYRGSVLELYRKGTLHGEFFSTAASGYTGMILSGQEKVYALPDPVPEKGVIVLSRLYLYTTWSHDTSVREGISASPAVFWNGKELKADAVYEDRKGSGIYDYPVETFAYDVSSIITAGEEAEVRVVNSGSDGHEFAAYGLLLLAVVEDPVAPQITYWICEGSDIIFADSGFGTTAADARTSVAFTGDAEIADLSGASLLLVSTAASGLENDPHQVLFNGAAWDNPLSAGSSAISIADLDVLSMVSASGNTLEIASVPVSGGGDYMENRNAVLVLIQDGAGEVPSAAGSSGNFFEWFIGRISALFGFS